MIHNFVLFTVLSSLTHTTHEPSSQVCLPLTLQVILVPYSVTDFWQVSLEWIDGALWLCWHESSMLV